MGLAAFQAAVEQAGFFFPPDPSNASSATIGGAVGVDARGPRACKYGSCKDYVLGLEVIQADGTRLHTGANTVKNASGYDLTRLFVGARGTLCFYTRLRLRLLPLPTAAATLLVACEGLSEALALSASLLGAGLVPARLQALDRAAARLAGLAALLGTGALLLCELDGSAPAVATQVARVSGLAGAARVTDLSGAEASGLWARLACQPAALSLGVPRGRQAEFTARFAPPRQSTAVGMSVSPSAGQSAPADLRPGISARGRRRSRRRGARAGRRAGSLPVYRPGGANAGEPAEVGSRSARHPEPQRCHRGCAAMTPHGDLQGQYDETLKCVRCGLCQAVCPVFAVERSEAAVARGKVQLVRALLEGRVEPTPAVRERLFLCLNCGACTENCPSGVAVADIMLAGRAQLLREAGRPLVERLLLREGLGQRRSVRLAGLGLALYRRSGLRWLAHRFEPAQSSARVALTGGGDAAGIAPASFPRGAA